MQAQTAPRGEHAEPASSAQRATKSRLRGFFATALALGVAACGGAPIDEELAGWGDDAEESETSRLGTASLALDSLRARPVPSPPVARPVFSPIDTITIVTHDIPPHDIPPPPPIGDPISATPGARVKCPQCAFASSTGYLYLPLDMSSEAMTLKFMDPNQSDVNIALSLGREAYERRVYFVGSDELNSIGRVRVATVTDLSTRKDVQVIVFGPLAPPQVAPPQAVLNELFLPGLRLQEL